MASLASADFVRVTRDRATVWRADGPSNPLTVVLAGTILEVVEEQGAWLKVRLPISVGDPTVIGLILKTNVEPVTDGTQPPASAFTRPGRAASAAGSRSQRLTFRGFAEAGYLRFTASDSFNAVFKKKAALLPGAGLQLILPRGLFVSAEAEYFKLTGQRAFVLNGQVFSLGIEDVVTAIPLSATLGYHLGRNQTARPYVGIGAGLYLFKERSTFARASEDVSDRFASYHAVLGVNVMSRRRLSVAVEAQYTAVRNAIGEGGVSADFGESDLGGVTIRVKLLVR